MKKIRQRGYIYPRLIDDILGVSIIAAVASVSLICLATLTWVMLF